MSADKKKGDAAAKDQAIEADKLTDDELERVNGGVGNPSNQCCATTMTQKS